MEQSLTEIAQELRGANKKVQLIYAFNGTGKTRLSREFKKLIASKETGTEELAEAGAAMLYYNAFTEDLFYWDNDLDADSNRKIKIQPNSFTRWVLEDQGQENSIVAHFQRYTNDKLMPLFNKEYNEISFSIAGGNDEIIEHIKISKGEESCLIWCVFYSLLEQVVEVRNISEPTDRATREFDSLEYVFIDDPVSSLDDTHLIELAVNIAELIKSSQSNLRFIITTHNPLFYNVLFNEFNREKGSSKKILEKLDDGTYLLKDSKDSPFSYHLFLLSELDQVIKSGGIQKYHFNIFRNILEKSATFLGYDRWEDLLSNDADGAREGYYKRIINFSSHSKFAGEEIPVISESEKSMLARLVNDFKTRHGFKTSTNN